MSFHIHQRVVCIVQAKPHWLAITGGGSFPNKGDVVTIRNIDVWPTWTALRFFEHYNQSFGNRIEAGFSSEWFRPLDETRLDIFRQMLVSPSKKEKSPAVFSDSEVPA